MLHCFSLRQLFWFKSKNRIEEEIIYIQSQTVSFHHIIYTGYITHIIAIKTTKYLHFWSRAWVILMYSTLITEYQQLIDCVKQQYYYCSLCCNVSSTSSIRQECPRKWCRFERLLQQKRSQWNSCYQLYIQRRTHSKIEWWFFFPNREIW